MKNRIILIILSLSITYCTSNQVDSKYPVLGYLELDESILELSEVVDSLVGPWAIDASQQGKLYYTQIDGTVFRHDLNTGKQEKILKLTDVLAKKSYGLLGMAVAPDETYLLLHYTFAIPLSEVEETIKSRLVKYPLGKGKIGNPNILLDSLPGNTYHNGSRIVFGSDETIYFSLGDVGRTDLAQDDEFYGGKILRLNPDGSVPADNPIPGSFVWAKGLRNTQGLAFGSNDKLYGSDHGPLTDDEVNMLTTGGNYGWPDVHGYCDTVEETIYCEVNEIIEPLLAWTPTVAAAGLAYYGDTDIPELHNSLLLATMKGRSIRVLKLNNGSNGIASEQIYFQETFGRIRDIAVAPNGDIFFITSNTDWHPRFNPWMYDGLPEGPDRIIRLRKISRGDIDTTLVVYREDTESMDLMDENWNPQVAENLQAGAKLYAQHCLNCHAPEGQGSEDMIPPLAATDWVTGDKGRLIRLVLKGMSGTMEVNGKTYNQEMPSYRHLGDVELAEILTFIRNSFGNEAGTVIPSEVYEERKAI